MVSCLSGKDSINKLNLTGKTNTYISNIPFEIKKLKIRIMNTLILPLISKQWINMKKNMFLLDSFKQKIDYYYNSYKLEEILLYKDILQLCEVFIAQSNQLEEIEKKIYSSSNLKESDKNISLIYQTTMIKLKPEYELYDNILGKPLKSKKQKYNDDIINDLQKWMTMDNITYEKIKEFIENKYTTLKHF